MFLFIFERETETETECEWGERQREREIQNPKQAPGSELSAQSQMWGGGGAQTQEPQDHYLSRSQKLNQLSHPGTP